MNASLVIKLLRKGAPMFLEEKPLRDKSPFIQAIDMNANWAIDLFCDHGADLSVKDSRGLTPILRATKLNMAEVSLYLALRMRDSLDLQEDENGHNTFVLYFLNRDYNRCRQFLMRGANVNHQNSSGKTALHLAVELHMDDKAINFLLKVNANPHLEDNTGMTCCDKARFLGIYKHFDELYNL